MNNLTKLKSFLLVFFVSVVMVPSHSIEAQTSLPSQESPAHANYGSITATDLATPLPDALEKILGVVGKHSNPPSLEVSPYGYPPNPIYFSRMVFQAYTDQWEIQYGSPDPNISSLNDLGWVIQHPSNDTQPRLNRGASEVVFVSDRFGANDILSASFDGSNLLRLTNNSVPDVQPVWSPDNRQIAFVSYRSENQDIYLMNKDGSNQRPLFFDAASDFNPSWSPDSSQLVFVTAV